MRTILTFLIFSLVLHTAAIPSDLESIGEASNDMVDLVDHLNTLTEANIKTLIQQNNIPALTAASLDDAALYQASVLAVSYGKPRCLETLLAKFEPTQSQKEMLVRHALKNDRGGCFTVLLNKNIVACTPKDFRCFLLGRKYEIAKATFLHAQTNRSSDEFAEFIGTNHELSNCDCLCCFKNQHPLNILRLGGACCCLVDVDSRNMYRFLAANDIRETAHCACCAVPTFNASCLTPHPAMLPACCVCPAPPCISDECTHQCSSAKGCGMCCFLPLPCLTENDDETELDEVSCCSLQ